MIWRLLLLGLLWAPAAHADEAACASLSAVPEAFQVAWISPLRKRTRGRRYLEVVPVSQLRAVAKREQGDLVRTLQALGMLGPKGIRWLGHKEYKITMFDIRAEWLCRPVTSQAEGELLAGIPVCATQLQDGNRFYTGCGYTLDTVSEKPGVQVFKIRWRDAVSQGFCVMPMERFLSGA